MNVKLLSGDPALPVLALVDSAPMSCLDVSGYLGSLYSTRLSYSRSEILSSCRLERLPPREASLSFPASVFCILNLYLGSFHPFVMTGVCLPSRQNAFFQRTEADPHGFRAADIHQAEERGAISKGGQGGSGTCHPVGAGVDSARCRLSYRMEPSPQAQTSAA